MSRTYRKQILRNKDFIRFPATSNEIRQLDSFKNDPDLQELGVRIPNRYNRKIPTCYDDLNLSSERQVKYSPGYKEK